MKKWETKEGDLIPYNLLKDSHLLNILKWIENKAKNGITIMDGVGSWDIDDVWFEETYYEDKEVLQMYDYRGLKKEAKKRKLIK